MLHEKILKQYKKTMLKARTRIHQNILSIASRRDQQILNNKKVLEEKLSEKENVSTTNVKSAHNIPIKHISTTDSVKSETINIKSAHINTDSVKSENNIKELNNTITLKRTKVIEDSIFKGTPHTTSTSQHLNNTFKKLRADHLLNESFISESRTKKLPSPLRESIYLETELDVDIPKKSTVSSTSNDPAMSFLNSVVDGRSALLDSSMLYRTAIDNQSKVGSPHNPKSIVPWIVEDGVVPDGFVIPEWVNDPQVLSMAVGQNHDELKAYFTNGRDINKDMVRIFPQYKNGTVDSPNRMPDYLKRM